MLSWENTRVGDLAKARRSPWAEEWSEHEGADPLDLLHPGSLLIRDLPGLMLRVQPLHLAALSAVRTEL